MAAFKLNFPGALADCGLRVQVESDHVDEGAHDSEWLAVNNEASGLTVCLELWQRFECMVL